MLRRTAFKQLRYERVRSVPVPIVECHGVIVKAGDAVNASPKAVKAKPGKRAPTVEEAKWMAAVVNFGCVACWLDKQPSRPTAVHHLLRGGRRIGHLFTLGLCDPGHHQGGEQLGMVSRHPYKARFEAKYGTELELLGMLKKELGFFDEWKVA